MIISQRIFAYNDLLAKFSPVETKITSNTPFPEFKTTGDEKHDLETYIEDLIDYCIVHNWYYTSEKSEAAGWTKSDKAMACLRASLSPAVRTVYKYSLGRTQAAQAPAVR